MKIILIATLLVLIISCKSNDDYAIKETDSAILYLALRNNSDSLLNKYFKNRRIETLAKCKEMTSDQKHLLQIIRLWYKDYFQRDNVRIRESVEKWGGSADDYKLKAKYISVNENVDVDVYDLRDSIDVIKFESNSCGIDYLISKRKFTMPVACIDSLNYYGEEKMIIGLNDNEIELISKYLRFDGIQNCLSSNKKDKINYCKNQISAFNMLSKYLNLVIFHDNNGIHSSSSPELYKIDIGEGFTDEINFRYMVHPSYPCGGDLYNFKNKIDVTYKKSLNGIVM